MENQTSFKWTKESTQLIIHEYKSRKAQFRDPKKKKKDLWLEIKMKFLDFGYDISLDLLGRKFRNLKETYTDIKDKNNRTGSGRINWEYFDTFDEIFSDDRAINSCVTMSSMDEDGCVDTEVLGLFEISASSPGFSSRKRVIKDYRQEQLEIERAKLVKMDRLIDNIEKNSKIHDDRNMLLQQIIDLKFK